MLYFEIGVCEESSTDGLETCIGGRKEDTSNIDDIARVDQSSHCAMAVYSELSWDVAYGYLVRHLLDLDLLERQEFGRPRRKIELTLGVILLAGLRRTHDKRGELF